MPNRQLCKRTASGVLQGDPLVGQLIINTPSGYLYTTRDDGSLVLINGYLPYYGSFYDTTTQTNASGTAVNKLSYNTTAEARGVAVVSGSLVQVANSGTYNVQFSAQLEKGNASTDEIYIWLAKNNVNVPNSNTAVTMKGAAERMVAAWNWVLTLDRNEHVELRWNSTDTTTRILYSGGFNSPTRPDIPSVILTVNRVA